MNNFHDEKTFNFTPLMGKPQLSICPEPCGNSMTEAGLSIGSVKN